MFSQTDRSFIRAGGGRLPWLLAAALVALTLALGGRTAAAADPVLTTPENPVTVPFGQGATKPITVSWNLNGAVDKALLQVTDNANPMVPVYLLPVLTPAGTSGSFSVAYGKTYTARLKDVVNPAKTWGAPLVITTKHPNIKFDFGCLVQCITDVDVTPHGTWAQFTIKTNEQVYMTLKASTKAPNANGEWSNPADVVSSSTTFLPTQQWTPTLNDLTPNTTFHYAIQATDTNSNKQVKTGTFKTLKRQATVTFAQLHMIDDSDGFGAGDCDCHFWFKAGDAAPKKYGPNSVASGTTVNPNITFTVLNAADQLKLGAFGNDDDTDFGQFCPYGTGADSSWGSFWTDDGSNTCHDWSAHTITVPIAVSGPGEEITKSFELGVFGPALDFKVTGSIVVKYVP